MEADTQSLDGVLRTHLSSAAGYYYHLLTHLQLSYKLTVDGVLSWGFPSTQQGNKSCKLLLSTMWGIFLKFYSGFELCSENNKQFFCAHTVKVLEPLWHCERMRNCLVNHFYMCIYHVLKNLAVRHTKEVMPDSLRELEDFVAGFVDYALNSPIDFFEEDIGVADWSTAARYEIWGVRITFVLTSIS